MTLRMCVPTASGGNEGRVVPSRPLVKTVVVPLKVSSTVTVPVGVPPPGGATVTVIERVRGWPKAIVGLEEVSVVFVLALLTTNVSGVEVLVRKLLSPL